MAASPCELAHALLGSGLGQRGFIETVSIISLEQILRDIEQGKGPKRDPEMYFFSNQMTYDEMRSIAEYYSKLAR